MFLINRYIDILRYMNTIDWQEAAECLRLLSHPQRLQIIHLLLNEEWYCVGDIATTCNLLHNVASEHLKLLKSKGFLTAKKEGKFVYYTIADSALSSLFACIEKRFKQ